MRDEAENRIGYLYPKATLQDGSQATVIAWLWARTVRSPDPSAKGAMVPLVSSFMLSTKATRKAWVEPMIDAHGPETWRFEVRTGTLSKEDEDRLKKGTKGEGRGSSFSCILTGSLISGDYIKREGMAGRMGARLMAIVAEGDRARIYLSPTGAHESIAVSVDSEERVLNARETELNQAVPAKLTGGTCFSYGQTTFGSLFTSRQLMALTTFSDLIVEARAKVASDCQEAGLERPHIVEDGDNNVPIAYADAVATYLAFALNKLSTRSCTQTAWYVDRESTMAAFARQAIPMTWDFAEMNTLLAGSGSFGNTIEWECEAIERLGFGSSIGFVSNLDAAKNHYPMRPVVVSSDPPYYDNIAYADLSDFFYVWLKRSLSNVWPDLFRRLATPKDNELVASSYRHGGRDEAERFFMSGMSEALVAMCNASTDDEPLAIYYAFKQSEIGVDGTTSAGWASFLQAVTNAGLTVDRTWPVRTEQPHGLRVLKASALASSVVLVCRKRSLGADVITRADFVRALKREMPAAIDAIRRAGVGPVDMQQSVIGPGMGVFSRYGKVLEDDDRAMPVKTALSLINRVWEEIDQELDAAFDAETQVALAWFATYGFDARQSGELITLANAKNIGTNALFESGVFKDLKGKTALTPRDELPKTWTPASDKSLTVWECVQHTARVLNAEDGGGAAAGRLVAEMGPKAAEARALAYRLFEIATQKGWAAEALIYNELAQEWPKLEDLASSAQSQATTATAQAELF